MDVRIKSINDTNLLHLTGFFDDPVATNGKTKQLLNTLKLAKFCGVSTRTIQRWAKDGLPRRTRAQLENLHSGEYLPPAFREAEISIHHDGIIMLRDGFHISIETLKFWRFIVFGVDWQRVRDIEQAINLHRRLPITLFRQHANGYSNTLFKMANTSSIITVGAFSIRFACLAFRSTERIPLARITP